MCRQFLCVHLFFHFFERDFLPATDQFVGFDLGFFLQDLIEQVRGFEERIFIIKEILKMWLDCCGIDSSGSRPIPKAGFCKRVHEASAYINYGTFYLRLTESCGEWTPHKPAMLGHHPQSWLRCSWPRTCVVIS